MPITRVRIIDPQYQFEDLPGYIAQVFPDHSLAFGVVFPETMVSRRYAIDDLEVDGFISQDEFRLMDYDLQDVRWDNSLQVATPLQVDVTPVFQTAVEMVMEILDIPETQDFLAQENEPIQENEPEPPEPVIETPIPNTRNLRQLPLPMPEEPEEFPEQDLQTLLAGVPRGAGLGIVRKPGSPHHGWMCWWDIPPDIPRRPSRPGLLYRVNLLLQNGQTLDVEDRGMRSYYEDNLEILAPMGQAAA
jgi:hypothetical protein